MLRAVQILWLKPRLYCRSNSPESHPQFADSHFGEDSGPGDRTRCSQMSDLQRPLCNLDRVSADTNTLQSGTGD